MGRGSSKASGGIVKRFDDTSKNDGYAYSGDGSDIDAYFLENSNMYDLIDRMTDDDKSNFIAWGEGFFMYGQQYDGWEHLTSREKQRVNTYDEFIDQSVLKQDIEVVRLSTAEMIFGKGNKNGSLEDFNKTKGQVITCVANLSTAAAKEGLTVGVGDKSVEYHIKVPKNVKGAGMYIGNSEINFHGNSQREFMLNRNLLYKVGKTTYDSKRKVFKVDLTVIGREKHDYGN